MKANRAQLPKGMRDFSPQMVARRRYMMDLLAHYFQRYGFAPLETPAMELLSTLSGKYGDEGDRLLFKVLNSGDFLGKVKGDLQEMSSAVAATALAEKGLRYDLTIPLARYVAQHHHTLVFPFKRSQMQPVWRADRPQKGRYREFYQCDIDVLGASSCFAEVEILVLVHEVMEALGIKDFKIALNHRGIFKALAKQMGDVDKEQDLCRWLDKLDKLPREQIKEGLLESGFPHGGIEKLDWLFDVRGSFEERIAKVRLHLGEEEEGKEACEVLCEMEEYRKSFALKNWHVEWVPTLARGMDYYTGPIFELIVEESGLGSVGGGGRYDNLAERFGVSGIAGVGFSFGLERLYDLMVARDLFPKEAVKTTTLLLLPLGENSESVGIKYLHQLRQKGIDAELLPALGRLSKGLKYGEKRGIPWVGILGEDECKAGTVTLKNMDSGKQLEVNWAEAVEVLQGKR